MKRRARVLLSTISTAAMTAVFGLPAEASKPSADGARTPIERLASIREAYLLALKNEWSIRVRRTAIKSRNSATFRISPISRIGEIDNCDNAGRLRRPDPPPHPAVDAILQHRLRVLLSAQFAMSATGCPSISSRRRFGLSLIIRSPRPTSPSSGTLASPSCCRWNGTGKPLHRLCGGGAGRNSHSALGADQRHAGERRMAQFFRGHSVRVGVSLGGPAWLHDFRRRTRSGKGTHARVMQGISSAPFLKGRSSSMRQIMG